MSIFSRILDAIKRAIGLVHEIEANPQVRAVIKIVQDLDQLQSASDADKREYAVKLAMEQLGVSESVARFLVETAVQALKRHGAL